MNYLILLVLLAGCANVTTTKISRTANGDVKIDSGKDVHIGGLHLQDGPVTLDVTDYSSNANTDAINAQGKREVDLTNAAANAVLKGLAAGAGLIKP